MLTVSYFCMATELRFNNESSPTCSNGDMWHSKAVEYSCLFLPGSCPIVKHYISSYYKHYACDLPVIPENEIVENKIDILRGDVEEDVDTVVFAKIIPVEKVNPIETSNAPKISKPGFKLNLSNLNKNTSLIKSLSSRDVIKKSCSLNQINQKESLTDRSEKRDNKHNHGKEDNFKSLTSRDDKDNLEKLLKSKDNKLSYNFVKTKKEYKPSFNTFYGKIIKTKVKDFFHYQEKDSDKFKIYKQSSAPSKPKNIPLKDTLSPRYLLNVKVDPVEIKYSLSPRLKDVFLNEAGKSKDTNCSTRIHLRQNNYIDSKLNSPMSTLSQIKIKKLDTLRNINMQTLSKDNKNQYASKSKVFDSN